MAYGRFRIAVLFGAAVCLMAARVACADVSIPGEARHSLGDVSKALGSFSVSWREQFESPTSHAEAIKNLNINPGEPDFFAPADCQVSFQTGKVYSVSRGPDAIHESAFDGEKAFIGTRSFDLGGHPAAVLQIYPLDKLNAHNFGIGLRIQTEYFSACGIWIPIRAKDLAAGQPPESEIIHLIDLGASVTAVESASVGGREMLHVTILAEDPQWQMERNTQDRIQRELNGIPQMRQLPSHRVHDFYLDPAMNYALKRHIERYPDGTLLLDITNDDFAKLKDRNVWLPRKCLVDYYAWPGAPGTFSKTPMLSRTFNADELKFGAADPSTFQLNYTIPGTLVRDESGATTRQYQLP